MWLEPSQAGAKCRLPQSPALSRNQARDHPQPLSYQLCHHLALPRLTLLRALLRSSKVLHPICPVPLLAAIMKTLAVLSLLSALASASPIRQPIDSQTIPDSYNVFFKDHVSPESAAAHHSWVQDIHGENERFELRKRDQAPMLGSFFDGLKHTYDLAGALGYAGHFGDGVIDQIRQHPDVSLLNLQADKRHCGALTRTFARSTMSRKTLLSTP